MTSGSGGDLQAGCCINLFALSSLGLHYIMAIMDRANRNLQKMDICLNNNKRCPNRNKIIVKASYIILVTIKYQLL